MPPPDVAMVFATWLTTLEVNVITKKRNSTPITPKPALNPSKNLPTSLLLCPFINSTTPQTSKIMLGSSTNLSQSTPLIARPSAHRGSLLVKIPPMPALKESLKEARPDDAEGVYGGRAVMQTPYASSTMPFPGTRPESYVGVPKGRNKSQPIHRWTLGNPSRVSL